MLLISLFFVTALTGLSGDACSREEGLRSDRGVIATCDTTSRQDSKEPMPLKANICHCALSLQFVVFSSWILMSEPLDFDLGQRPLKNELYSSLDKAPLLRPPIV